MDTFLSVAGLGGGGVIAAACAYKILRPRFPVRVNCWFCSADTVVPYGNQNCWDCPKCEQYNGFEKDGGYNKEIPAQHLEDLNFGIGCKPEEYLGSASGLCEACEQNQLLKVRQLASFMPMIEDNYDAEIDAYKDHLERVYELCDPCKIVVERELMKQDDALRGKLVAENLENSGTLEASQSHMVSFNAQPAPNTGGYVLSLLCLLCSCLILSYRLSQCHWVYVNTWLLTDFVHAVKPYQQALHYLGLGLCLMSKLLIGKDRLRGVDVTACFVWLLCAVTVTRDITQLLPPIQHEDRILAVLFSVNFVISFTACIIRRERNTATTKTFKRLSLDKSTGSTLSETDTAAISSVSTSRRARPDPDPVPQVTDEPIDDLDLEMDAFSLGPKTNTLKRSDSGMFSMAGSQASFSTASAVPRPLLAQPRPLISPARLNFRLSSSTPTNAFSQTSTFNRPTMTNPAFDSKSRQSLQFTSLQKPTSDNLFLQRGLTVEKLSLFNSQNSTDLPTVSQVSSTPQGQASPLRSNLWQHAKFAQTHLSPDKLSQCKFTSLSGMTPPASNFQPDVSTSVSRPNTPIRKSLWQQHVVGEGNTQAVPVVENNVFSINAAGKSKCVSSQPKRNASLFNNDSTTFLTSLDGCELKQRQTAGVEKDSTLVGNDESSKSSVCPVDSTTITEPKKFNSLKRVGIGAVLLASIMGNAVLGVYLYTKS